MNPMIELCLGFHELHPFDAVHGRSHHGRVVVNLRAIISSEQLEENIDEEAVLIAGAIHDAVDEKRGDIEPQIELLQNYFEEIHMQPSLAKSVLETVHTHSYGHVQESVEQQLLFDADKLDYVEKERMDELSEALVQGHMTEEQLQYYLGLWIARVPNIPNMLHFESSKTLFLEKTQDFLTHIKEKYPQYHRQLEEATRPMFTPISN